MTAPTLVSYTELNAGTNGVWTDGGSPRSTASVSWLAGDIIVVVGGDEDGSNPITLPTATGLTFTSVFGAQIGTTSSFAGANIWTATAGANGSSAVASGHTGSSNPGHYGIGVWVWRASGGVGNHASGTNAATVSLVRSGANSVVCGGLFDWNATATTGYAFTPTVGHDRQHLQDNVEGGGQYSIFVADWGDQGSAGTTSYGISAPSGTKCSTVVVEILGTSSGTNVDITGVVTNLDLAAPAGTISTSSSSDVSLTGVVTNLDLAAPLGTCSASSTSDNVSLTGVTVDLALAAPVGSATLTTNIADTGVPADLTFAAPAGTVTLTGSVTLTGAVSDLSFAAPAGSVGLGSDVNLTGAVSDLAFASPAGSLTLTGSVTLTGEVSDIALAAPAGTADINSVGDVILTGLPVALVLAAPAGSSSPTSDITLSGEVSALALAAAAGTLALTSLVDLVGVTAGMTLDAPAGSIGEPEPTRLVTARVQPRTLTARPQPRILEEP